VVVIWLSKLHLLGQEIIPSLARGVLYDASAGSFPLILSSIDLASLVDR
jgi:hypothetical protein